MCRCVVEYKCGLWLIWSQSGHNHINKLWKLRAVSRISNHHHAWAFRKAITYCSHKCNTTVTLIVQWKRNPLVLIRPSLALPQVVIECCLVQVHDRWLLQQLTTPAALHILASCAPITLQYDSLLDKFSMELYNAHWFSYRAEAAGFHRLLFQVLFEWSEHALLDSNAPTPTSDSDPLYIQWSELTQLTNVYLRFCVAFEPNSHAECTCGLQSGLCLYLCWKGARSRS